MTEHEEQVHPSNTHMVRGPHPHTLPIGLYWKVFSLLIGLTFLTVFLSRYDFGSLSVIVTFLIAGTKAILVLAVFMHLWYDSKFFALVVTTSLVFLGLFLLFPLLDVGSRALVDVERENFLPRDERVYEYKVKNPQALPLRPGLQDAVAEKLIFEGDHH